MVLASVVGNVFLAISVLLALWSLSWLIRGSMKNPEERTAEMEARERIARGGPWVEGELPPRALSDDEIGELADAQRASSLEEAGIDAEPRLGEAPRRRFGRRRR